MKPETSEKENCEHCSKTYRRHRYHCNRGEAVYGLGIIGSLVYFWGSASTFLMFVFGFFKAVFWPAFLVYEALKFLQM